ncbi:hypothetical protein PAPYR_7187 [Paratrimastix pyriformis]|uniref:Methyltransferase domain-containing protein n=1 Tax=Paratrimastix pyriformis TaxID=342808 RepID=A0ABQ8UDL6_9EUKA|nr:hypothetical protein PAPYR_7187 [Paratrimastix pyriformis]|eukprot:GAFH01004701.1.p2 GENE.GAFH01004701.1~~GAFH01004701.1.p2  ORF type:complete len:206 (-),score=59.04 GAFH01004701.1:121-738(-)
MTEEEADRARVAVLERNFDQIFEENEDEGFRFPWLADTTEDKTLLAPVQFSSLRTARDVLRFAQVTPDDIIADLGAGDGRVAITAVVEFHAKRAIGVEIEEPLVLKGRQVAAQLGLGPERLSLHCANLMSLPPEVDQALDTCTLFFFYLLTPAFEALEERLVRALRRGARIVSLHFSCRRWTPVAHSEDGRCWLYTRASLPPGQE